VSNHPLGGADGVALGSIIGRHYDSKFRYLVNDILMNLPGLAPLCIPINKTGGQARNFPAMVKAGFESDNHILMYPAGLCSRRRNGEVRDLPWSKTFIVKSVQYQRDVVPIHFGGQNSDFFYKLANFSDKYVKKVNIAMIYLVDEMYKNVHKTFTVTIGKPIPWQTFDKSRTPAEWAQYVQDIVYQLPNNGK
jgi:putative hemolysin